MEDKSTGKELSELFRLFLRLGLTAFGGPAAHIAMMQREVVEKRGWMDHEHFLDMIGATNLLFSVDYPFSSNEQGRAFLDSLPLSEGDRVKVAFKNAERLLGITVSSE